jgi:hypothetical protein
MKYQYILNKELLYETNNTSEFLAYLVANSIAYTVLYDLLKQTEKYTCELVT